MEIPGFYLDQQTGKYYRINEQDPTFSSFLEKKKSHVQKPTVSSKPEHVLKILSSRETGLKKYAQFETSFLKLKLEKLNDLQHQTIPDLRKSPLEILYIKGGHKRIMGMWRATHYYFLGEIPHNSGCSSSFRLHLPRGVIDVCDGWDSNCLMVLSNGINGNVMLYLSDINEYRFHLKTECALFCCSSDPVKQQFVSGGENLIRIDNMDMHRYNKTVKGNVRSIQFNENGAIIYCGVHNGNLLMIDLRQPDYKKIKLYKYGVDELLLLSNKHDLLCGSFDGELSKFDLRMMTKVTEYFGHVHTPTKKPFSVDETMNLLCATGSDNKTRLWSLDGGNFIKMLEPPLKSEPHCAWLLSNDSTRTFCLVQQNKKHYVDF